MGLDANELTNEQRFAEEHPEFKDWERDSVHNPPPPERFDGKRVLLGYEQMGRDKIFPVPPDESKTYEQRVLAAKLEKLLGFLPERRADLLRRIYWERQTQAEVAADLGLSQQAVNQRLRTAEKQLLKVYLLHHDIEVEGDEL